MNILCNITSIPGRVSLLLLKNKFQVLKTGIASIQRKNITYSAEHLPFEQIQNLKKDVILYTFDKTKLIKYATIFGFAQLGIWIYYAGYLFMNLKDISNSKIETGGVLKESSLWRRINLGDWKYRIISTSLCLGVGAFTAFVTYTLPTRIVKELTLCKGGTLASFIIYGPFGRTKSFKVPLHKISCAVSRERAKSYIPIKIEKTSFYYLVDCKGKFHQPRLFDYTIGTRTAKF